MPMDDIRNWKNPDPTVETRIQNAPKLSRRGLSVDRVRKNLTAPVAKRMSSDALLKTNDGPRDFITGVEYRTKFIRDGSSCRVDLNQKCSSATKKQQSVAVDTRRKGTIKQRRTDENDFDRAQLRGRNNYLSKSAPCSGKRYSHSTAHPSKMSLERNTGASSPKKTTNEDKSIPTIGVYYTGSHVETMTGTRRPTLSMAEGSENAYENLAAANNKREWPDYLNKRTGYPTSSRSTQRPSWLDQKKIPRLFLQDETSKSQEDRKYLLRTSTKISKPLKFNSLHNSALQLSQSNSELSGFRWKEPEAFTATLIPLLEWVEKRQLPAPEDLNADSHLRRIPMLNNDVGFSLDRFLCTWKLCEDVASNDYQNDCSQVSTEPMSPVAPEISKKILPSSEDAISREAHDDIQRSKLESGFAVDKKTKPGRSLRRGPESGTKTNTIESKDPSPAFTRLTRRKAEKPTAAISPSSHPDPVTEAFTRPQSVDRARRVQAPLHTKRLSAVANRQMDGKTTRTTSPSTVQGVDLSSSPDGKAKKKPIWK